MALITIDLQEGFQNDTVSVYINGKEVYTSGNVSTRHQIGLADRAEVISEESSNLLEIKLPAKNIKVKKEIHSDKNKYIGVTLDSDKKLSIKEQSHEFWYA